MTPRQFKFHDGGKGAALAVRVTPRAKQDRITGIMQDGTVKISLTSPPLEGRANHALIELLSSIFSIPASRFEIVAGKNSRDKLVTVMGIEAQQLQEKILAYLEKNK